MNAKIDKQDILENYHKFSAQHFASKYGVMIGRIYAVASELGVSAPKRWDEDKESMLRDYTAGASLEELGRTYGHFKGNIKLKLEEWGARLRSSSESKQIYKLDQLFFQTIDTEEKAYWLGFVYADGNVYMRPERNKTVFQVGLSHTDTDHLIRLKVTLKAEHPLYQDAHGMRLMINNIQLVADLNRLGVHPRKSLTLTFPDSSQVPEHLLHHFIRGYFDGDGGVWIVKNKKDKQWGFSIISTKLFVEAIKKRLICAGVSSTKLSAEKRSGHGRIFSLVYGGSIHNCRKPNAITLYRYLYREAHVWLDRKRSMFETILTGIYGNDWR